MDERLLAYHCLADEVGQSMAQLSKYDAVVDVYSSTIVNVIVPA